jgi:hypothetical protein
MCATACRPSATLSPTAMLQSTPLPTAPPSPTPTAAATATPRPGPYDLWPDDGSLFFFVDLSDPANRSLPREFVEAVQGVGWQGDLSDYRLGVIAVVEDPGVSRRLSEQFPRVDPGCYPQPDGNFPATCEEGLLVFVREYDSLPQDHSIRPKIRNARTDSLRVLNVDDIVAGYIANQ